MSEPKKKAKRRRGPRAVHEISPALRSLAMPIGEIRTDPDNVRVHGERYHHVLNPHTGYPARGVMSVTVAAELAVDADALATAVFVLGPDDGMALVESMPGVDALMVTGDGDDVGTVLLSSGFEGKFTRE